MDNPENNAFTNTTPQAGFCATWAQYCPSPMVSINFPVTLSITKDLNPGDEPRNSTYFKTPNSYRNVKVYNRDTGEEALVRFRVSEISARLHFNSSISANTQVSTGWDSGSFGNAPPPCGSLGMAFYTAHWFHFLWRLPTNDAACYKITTIPRQGEPYNFNNMSLGYVLETPNPLLLSGGIYEGRLNLTISPGGDFDFGDNYQASDNELTINFTLSVNHELKLTTTDDDQKVSLQPCALGRNCTEEEGKANWERWIVTRATPQLTGRSNFRLSSSGAFTVYLQCEQQSGDDCGLKSDNDPSQVVPVQSLLTLPDNIVDQSTGATVVKRRLAQGRDLTRNVFSTKSFGENKAGSIDFLVSQRDVDTMLKTRPDTYRGAVTAIFDPQIY
ncbi:hypothetical protein ACFFJN_15990 [Erwinia mallotivora]|uniref:hypothetical protein n=1 Tax=Erwinia mallotivora TaxID=69222 RepID=UPI0035E9E8E3